MSVTKATIKQEKKKREEVMMSSKEERRMEVGRSSVDLRDCKLTVRGWCGLHPVSTVY